MCRRVNPTGLVLLVPGAPHRSVRPGFSDNDMAKICWAVRGTIAAGAAPTASRCRVVRRAGLSATDIRYLTAERVIDHDETGIEVRIAGPASRVVWVREDFESLVQAGVSGLRFGDLVVGAKQSRNVVGNVVDRAALHDCPHFDASRLRSTWLMWQNQPVALSVIMYAAGLKTARTLVDLLAYQDNADLTDGHVNELHRAVVMISADTVLAEHIVDTSNMVDMLIAGYRNCNRGRHRHAPLRQLLTPCTSLPITSAP